MPTYVYRCKACEHQFETVQRITEEPIKQCPECGDSVTRLLFPVGIVFKGAGFHVNDYPSSGSQSSSLSSGNGQKEDVKSEETSESKLSAAASKE
ncbi:MAG: zinc ribbon domain-containing protein [Armatimonadetes bacterium]|nr:zinc ribbon domain-containing protein [Armatimonadota bacterium]